MNRKGILAAGNWIIDVVKIIDEFPHQDGLANIMNDRKVNNGGSPYNILKDLSKLNAPFPLEACGLVGDDDLGQHIINDCCDHRIDISQIHKTNLAPTSYTDVMTVAATGRRTFFHNRGANALLAAKDIVLQNSEARFFLLAYPLLLDEMDRMNEHGRSQASYVFEEAQKLGFITCTDLVTVNNSSFSSIVQSALPFINYLFLNELEASKLCEAAIDLETKLDLDELKAMAQKIKRMGVKESVILHFPTGALAIDCFEKITIVPAFDLPQEYIKGSAGAGDAFAAGVLLGLHENQAMDQCLKIGICSASASLTDESCSEGVKSLSEVLSFEKLFHPKKL